MRSQQWKYDAARKTRKEGSFTPAEKTLWQYLRKYNRSTLFGCRFRRQSVQFGFILDFFCPSHSLAIEVDGPYHATRIVYDAQRDLLLAHAGIRTLRVSNQDVLQRINYVLDCIATALGLPSPPLPPEEAP